ncbi:MAG: two-component regulator propeller domain-containing protein, partial [Candidatus Latescibacteria bacterium]|nr:two-component regulator propeller domain-containing protein [Candidatus Latescibacterota bacterium]
MSQPSPTGHCVIACLIVVILSLFFTSKIRAARPYIPKHPDPITELWRWTSFPELEGLGLRCMVEAPDNTLWFGTDEDVWIYNGYEWKSYRVDKELNGNPINTICATKNGQIFIGTERGISQFDNGTWRFVFPSNNGFLCPTNDLLESHNGKLWAATAWGLLSFDSHNFTLFTSSEMSRAVKMLAPDLQVQPVPDGVVTKTPWQDGAGIRVAEAGATGLPRGQSPVTVWKIAPNGPGQKAGLKVGDKLAWILESQALYFNDALQGASGSTIALTSQSQRDTTTKRFTIKREPISGTFQEFSIFDIYETQDHALWIGLESGQILRYDPMSTAIDKAWQLYAQTDVTRFGRLPTLGQTHDGIIWAVSNVSWSEINALKNNQWQHTSLTKLGGSKSHTSILQTNDGTLWIGGSSLHVLRQNQWQVSGYPQIPISNHRLRLLDVSSHKLWVAGLGQGIDQFDYTDTQWLSFNGLN